MRETSGACVHVMKYAGRSAVAVTTMASVPAIHTHDLRGSVSMASAINSMTGGSTAIERKNEGAETVNRLGMSPAMLSTTKSARIGFLRILHMPMNKPAYTSKPTGAMNNGRCDTL